MTLVNLALDPTRAITQYCANNWNLDSGLPGNYIFAVNQTPDGYLWLGTQNGLVRFDGVDFTVFNRSRVPELQDDAIRALHVDPNGTLWIGTDAGGLSSFKDGRFTLYPLSAYPSFNRISSINHDRWGNTWIGSFKEGLSCLPANTGQLIHYTSKDGLPGDTVNTLYRDLQENLWIVCPEDIARLKEPGVFQTYPQPGGTSNHLTSCCYQEESDTLLLGTGNAYLLSLHQGQITRLTAGGGLPHPTITCLFEDKQKNLWIGSEGGLSRLCRQDKRLNTLPVGSVYAIYEDMEDNLWVGTLEKGLYRFMDGKFTTYTRNEGLAHDEIYCLHEGPAGDLWIGGRGGLNRVRDGRVIGLPGQADAMAKSFPDTASLPGSTVPAVLRGAVLALCEAPLGCLWIGTLQGLHRWDYGKNRITTFTTANGLPHNRVNYLYSDSHRGHAGSLWIATPGGVVHYNNDDEQKTGTLRTYTTREGLSGNFIEFVYRDRRGNLWIGTDCGLHTMSHDTIAAVTTAATPTTGNTLADKPPHGLHFICVYEDPGGALWFGTESGLFYHPGQEREPGGQSKPLPAGGAGAVGVARATLFTTQHGLFENHVYSVLECNSGCLWLGGRKGISQVKKQDLLDVAAGKIKHVYPLDYGVKDGMKDHWCSNAGCKTGDGRLWFPTGMGVAVIDPAQAKNPGHSPIPIIQEITCDGEPVLFQSPGDNPQSIELSPGSRRLEFRYTGVTFIKPQDTRFRIKLDGYDRRWVEMGTVRNTTYTELSPGHYTFRVTAIQPGGQWHPQDAVVSFYLRPYFYQTPWFYVLGVLVLTSSVFLLHRAKVRRLQAREKELALQVAERTEDLAQRNLQLEEAQQKITRSRDLIKDKNRLLEENSEKLKEMDKIKSRFFANISHEFRTPLTLIMGPLEQMLEAIENTKKAVDQPATRANLAPGMTVEKQKKKLELMLRNAQRLLDLINQLLELSKFESGQAKLRVVCRDIVPVVRGVTANFEPLCERSGLELEFSTEAEEIPVYIDTHKLEGVIANLLINAVKFTPAGGKITVTTRTVKFPGEPGTLSREQETAAGCTQSTISPATLAQQAEPAVTEYVEIRVADTGPGIPIEQLPHIFDRFYQADNIHERKLPLSVPRTFTNTVTSTGTGIGLAIVKETVQLHGGKIDVSSREGKGTEFIIILPLGDAHLNPADIAPAGVEESDQQPVLRHFPGDGDETEEQEDEVKEPAGPQLGQIHGAAKKEILLIVEDSADIRDYIRGALGETYQVEEAAGGAEGIEAALRIVPDLIISDVMMPGVDGYELCRTLKEDIATSHIPIILLTARASEENIVQGFQAGADDYITKPFSTTILEARIRNLIELRRQLQLSMKREMTSQPLQIAVSSIDEKFLKKLRRVIDENLSDSELNVESLAKLLEMDRSTLYRKVQALTGESPTDFIRSYRLKRGAEMLKQKNRAVIDIAFDTGFSSASYFTRCFKEMFHCLPSEYREMREE